MKGSSVISMIFLIISLLCFNKKGHSQSLSVSASAISELIATQTSESIELSFKSLSEDVRYHVIEKRQSNKLAFIKIGHLLPSDTNEKLYYNDADIDDGATYHYRIKTISKDDQITISDTVSYTLTTLLAEKENVYKYIYREDDNISMRLIINHDAMMEGGFYDNAGQLIQKVTQETVSQGLNEFSFDISTFDAGNYLLIIKVGKENIIERITVES